MAKTKFIGKYDQKIKFYTEGVVSDGGGGYVPSKQLELETWARIEQLNISKDIDQAQMSLPSVFRVAVQVRKGFQPLVSHIIEWRDKRFAIINAPQVEDVRLQKEWIFDIKERK